MVLNKIKSRSAWIVEWVPHRADKLLSLDKRPHILPYRWRAERVKDYMRCLYWNSPLHTPLGTILNINQRKPPGIFDTGMRYGDATHLRAVFVKDLRVFREGEDIVLEWTHAGRTEIDSKNERLVKVCPDSKRRVKYALLRNLD